VKRPPIYITEPKPGYYELWFGKWVLMGGTSFEYLDQLRRLMSL